MRLPLWGSFPALIAWTFLQFGVETAIMLMVVMIALAILVTILVCHSLLTADIQEKSKEAARKRNSLAQALMEERRKSFKHRRA